VSRFEIGGNALKKFVHIPSVYHLEISTQGCVFRREWRWQFVVEVVSVFFGITQRLGSSHMLGMLKVHFFHDGSINVFFGI
jgi:hypothetical protein